MSAWIVALIAVIAAVLLARAAIWTGRWLGRADRLNRLLDDFDRDEALRNDCE